MKKINDIIPETWIQNMYYLIKNMKTKKEAKAIGQIITIKEKQIEKYMQNFKNSNNGEAKLYLERINDEKDNNMP